ncbi:MAG TPA: hypothetical protein VIF62_23635 [Labilithrix sp.]
MKKTALPVALLVVLVACGSSSNRAGFDDGSGSGPTGTGIGGTDPSLGNQAQPGGETPSAAYTPPAQLGCASRAQDILALDFRSGWWAGGGGGAYSGVVLPAVVNACPLTSIDYHHFETSQHVKCVYKESAGGSCNALPVSTNVADIVGSFVHPNIGDYTQIWILSGSDQDPSDIPVGDQIFQTILGDTTGACIPLLVAAGDGFMMHAKAIANDLKMGDVFSIETNPPSFFSVSLTPAASQTTLSGSQLATHLLFKDVPSLVDHVGNFMGAAKGDSLVESVPAPTIYDVIAHDSAGKATIAVGAAKLPGDGYRPFIFDAGWQRMYVLGDAGTAQYLKNIVMWMGLVGCKAAPIGPPH